MQSAFSVPLLSHRPPRKKRFVQKPHKASALPAFRQKNNTHSDPFSVPFQSIPALRMVSCLITPPGNIGKQFFRDSPAVWKLYGSLAGSVFFQTPGKLADCLRPRIQAHMIFKTGKLDDIMLLPIRRHTPRNSLLCLRQRCTQRFPDFFQVWPYSFRLRRNILLNRFRRFPAEMALFPPLKRTPALGTCPHRSSLLYSRSLTVTKTLSPGFFPIRKRISFRMPMI